MRRGWWWWGGGGRGAQREPGGGGGGEWKPELSGKRITHCNLSPHSESRCTCLNYVSAAAEEQADIHLRQTAGRFDPTGPDGRISISLPPPPRPPLPPPSPISPPYFPSVPKAVCTGPGSKIHDGLRVGAVNWPSAGGLGKKQVGCIRFARPLTSSG